MADAREPEGTAGQGPDEPEGRGPVLRTFFAVELDGAARAAAAGLAERLRAELAGMPGGDAVRWVRPEAYHVTLRFVGATAAARLGPLVEGVRAETAPLTPFALALGESGGLPDARRPRVVVQELADAPAGALAALAAAVERGVVAAGFPPEPRAFRAHLTLGRVDRRARRGPRLPALAGAPACVDVRDLVLFRSETLPGGSRYSPLERIALGGAPSP